jgi:ComF family protein
LKEPPPTETGWLNRLLSGIRPANAAGIVRRTGAAGLNLLLPPLCVLCDSAVRRQDEFCSDCFARIGFISEPRCRRCGVPFVSDGLAGADRTCPACQAAPPVFQRAVAAFRYDAEARRLILPFKHGDQTALTGVLVRHMVRAGVELLERAEVLVPVPLHRRRLFIRRYNQAALLSQAVGAAASRPVILDGLARMRMTTSLGTMTAEERAASVAGAFAVRPKRRDRLSGRRVLLIDDVITSGATANACATALLEAGALSVDVLLAARVPDPRLE